jgi:hypothetical protein
VIGWASIRRFDKSHHLVYHIAHTLRQAIPCVVGKGGIFGLACLSFIRRRHAMGQDSEWLHLKLLMLIGLIVSLGLTGCIRVEVIDRQPNIDLTDSVASSVTPDEHDLAILAVDFDPPLDDYEQLLDDPDGITLMIAIENTGLSTESDVLIAAQLSTDEGETILVEREAEIVSIAPGETQVVRFTNIPCPPYRPAYRLSVKSVAVPGETNLVDNFRLYDLHLIPTSESK